MLLITSDRGTRFYLCKLSATDPGFPKYPRLPVIQCKGYARGSGQNTKAGSRSTTSLRSGAQGKLSTPEDHSGE